MVEEYSSMFEVFGVREKVLQDIEEIYNKVLHDENTNSIFDVMRNLQAESQRHDSITAFHLGIMMMIHLHKYLLEED